MGIRKKKVSLAERYLVEPLCLGSCCRHMCDTLEAQKGESFVGPSSLSLEHARERESERESSIREKHIQVI